MQKMPIFYGKGAKPPPKWYHLFIFDGESDKLIQQTNCLNDLDNWFKSNKLTLNLDKTSRYSIFS